MARDDFDHVITALVRSGMDADHVNELVDIVANIAGKKISKRYDLTKPQGVRGRNSDNTRLREVLQWEPSISLEDGLNITYHWIAGELEKQNAPENALVTS